MEEVWPLFRPPRGDELGKIAIRESTAILIFNRSQRRRAHAHVLISLPPRNVP